MAITAADIRREVKEKNVTFLRLMFSDILGVMKNVEIPATDEQLDKVLSNKAMFDGSSIEGFVRINESDMYLYPDLDTWTVFPWGDENGAVAGLICDIYTSAGEPFAGDPRGNLKKALRHMEEVGYKSFNLGPEPEEEEEDPEDTEDIDEPVKEHKEPKRRRRQKKEEIPSDDQTILGFKLLKLAKGIVLNDISENFESEIVTSSAMKKMISEYLGKEKSSISNSGAILSAVLDEVSEKHYDGNTSYGELTSEILDSIKSDLK